VHEAVENAASCGGAHSLGIGALLATPPM